MIDKPDRKDGQGEGRSQGRPASAPRFINVFERRGALATTSIRSTETEARSCASVNDGPRGWSYAYSIRFDRSAAAIVNLLEVTPATTSRAAAKPRTGEAPVDDAGGGEGVPPWIG